MTKWLDYAEPKFQHSSSNGLRDMTQNVPQKWPFLCVMLLHLKFHPFSQLCHSFNKFEFVF